LGKWPIQNLWCLRDGIDQHHQRRGDESRAEWVVATPGLPVTLLSGTILGAKASAAAPMGTLRKKMYCQPM